MRFPTRSLAALALAFALAGCAPDGPSHDEGPRTVDTEGDTLDATTEVLVDLTDGTTLDAFLARFPQLSKDQVRFNSPNVEDEAIAVVRLGPNDAGLLEALRKDPLVEVAEPNLRLALDPLETETLAGGDMIPEDQAPKIPLESFPNDPMYGKQWNMETVHARDAWRYATGKGVIVAVIDTGVAYEDAKGIWAPDLDRERFVPGYDFVNDDAIAADDHGHGTHCAGTIGQATNNGRGVIGLAMNCKIMPLKVLSAGGSGTVVDIVDAIRFAADHGADVLSLSLGGGGHSKAMAQAVAYARGKGCLVVCAAGNGGRERVEYPAAYPGATAVSSVGPGGALAYYSSFGKETFIAAPGGDKKKGVESGVLQNTIGPRGSKGTFYAWWQGTSMATPHVAGAAALLHECGVTRPDAIESILASTADPAPGTSGWSKKFGHGILDAGGSVHRALFLPGLLTLGLCIPALVIAGRRHSRLGLAVGMLAGGAGLFFLRPLGLGELPLVGGFVTRGMADWDIPLFGPGWHWTPLFASALIPGALAWLSIAIRPARPLLVGLALGWAARLVTGVLLPWADVRFVPGAGLLDAVWLLGNAAVLVMICAAVTRLGKGRDPVSV